MTILSLDDLNNSVDEIYGRKKKTAENIIAPKKSALSTFNPSQPMAEPTPEVAPDILHPTDLHKAVLDAYSNTPTTEMPTKASFMSQLGRGIASLADVAYEPVPSTLGAVTQAVARPFTTPKKAEELGGQVTSSLNQPFGKAFGVTETPEYKQEASRALTDLISKYGNIGTEKLTELAHKSGIPYLKDLPIEDVRNMVGTLAAGVAPEAGKAVGKELKMVGNAIKEKLPSVRVELQNQLDGKQMIGVGAANTEQGLLRQTKANELLVPMGDDFTKSQITRNPADVQWERETAKNPQFGGPLQEKYALQNQKIQQNLQAEIDATGAEKVGLPASDFGKVVTDTFQKYKSERKKVVDDAYQAAKDSGELEQQVPIDNLKNYIEKVTKDRPTLKSKNPILGVIEEEIKANNPNGTGKITLAQMEDIRQVINNEMEPTQKGSIYYGKNLKKQIDAITKDAGGDIYKDARQKYANFENEFENQGVIRDINRLKKGGVDRVVPLENIVNHTMLKGPASDVQAVFSSLEKAGPEGQQLINELRGQVAEHIRQEATKGVGRDINGKPYVSTANLNSLITSLDKSGKLDLIFGKQQAERYRTLNDATIDLQTVPKDTVNTSGTTSTMLAALAEMGAQEMITGHAIPGISIAKFGYKQYQSSQKMKKVLEHANPTTKLSDIGKP